jgi:hypothetical protein
VAARAVLLVFYVKTLLPIVTPAAEFSLGYLAHLHLVGSLSHLEDLVMTSCAFEALIVNVKFMTKDNRRSILGREGQIPAANLLGKRTHRDNKANQKHRYDEQSFHITIPPSVCHKTAPHNLEHYNKTFRIVQAFSHYPSDPVMKYRNLI